MNKKIIMTAAATLLAVTANAAPITAEQALARAFSGSAAKSAPLDASGLSLVHTNVMDNGVASAYIFAKPAGQGFAVLSADDSLTPVLGYSGSGSVDPDNLPPSLVWWLGEYGRKAQWLAEKGVDVSQTRPYAPDWWTAVGPLMTTTWNQDAPYNDNCPVVSGVKAPTGCVATSFAQVMNYFKYPESGRGTIRYSDNGVIRSMSISKKFEWDNMLDSYTAGRYNDTQAAAVAYLMQACGYAVEMGYGASASGAQSFKLVNAMVTYFKYSADAIYREREAYSTSAWTQMVYDNIRNVGPVIYDGRSIDGGHSFVCDGYDGNGYFHFNWGWGGMSDGYFLLDSLSPESQGIGGAEGGFNYSQGAVFNMRKPDGSVSPDYDNMKVMGTVVPSLSGRDITFRASNGNSYAGWGNASWRQISCEIGAIFEKADGTPVSEVAGTWSGLSSGTISLGVYSYYSTQSVNPVITVPENLADGKYRVVLAARQSGMMDDDNHYPWQPLVCNWGDANYCWLTVSGGQLSVQTVDPGRLSFSGVGLGSPLYVNRNTLLDLEVANDSEMELAVCFYPALYRNNRLQYRSDYLLVSVDAEASVNKKALVSFVPDQNATSLGAGEYELKLIDAATESVIAEYGKFEMSSVAAGFTLSLDDFSVPGASVKDIELGSRTFKDVYEINDASSFDIKFDYSVTKGYFDSSVRVIMAAYDAANNRFVSTGEDYYYDTPFIGEGITKNVVIPMDMSSYNLSTVYRVTATYMQNGQNRTLGNMYISFDTTGVDEVEIGNDDNTAAEYYNLQGVRIAAPFKGQIVLRRIGDKVEKVVF